MLQDPNLSSILKIRHGFFTREGGVSQGIYASLNCGPGSKDDAAHIKENRNRACQKLGTTASALCTLEQVHSNDVMIIHAPFPDDQRPQADAMVSKTPGVVLGILTADCAPVLLADPINHVIGAAHAGWKGAFGGVVQATVQAMVELGAQAGSIVAAIGPCIAQRSYDVDLSFSKPFIERDPTNGVYFVPSVTKGKIRFGLRGYVMKELGEAGVTHISWLENDTYAEEQQFFSYRRATHKNEPDYGRQLSAITLV
jgi:YfiH family protein